MRPVVDHFRKTPLGQKKCLAGARRILPILAPRPAPLAMAMARSMTPTMTPYLWALTMTLLAWNARIAHANFSIWVSNRRQAENWRPSTHHALWLPFTTLERQRRGAGPLVRPTFFKFKLQGSSLGCDQATIARIGVPGSNVIFPHRSFAMGACFADTPAPRESPQSIQDPAYSRLAPSAAEQNEFLLTHRHRAA